MPEVHRRNRTGRNPTTGATMSEYILGFGLGLIVGLPIGAAFLELCSMIIKKDKADDR